MSEITVPGPEPDWEAAFQYQGGKRNPVQQYCTFDEAMGWYREIAGLGVNITDIARRLRLLLEPGLSDQLGSVDAAFFAVRQTRFAVHRYGTDDWTMLSVDRKCEIRALEAVDIVLEVLGVDWRAVESVNIGDGRDPLFLEPVLDDDLRPTFPEIPDDAERSGSGT